MNSFKELKVWQRSMILATEIYRNTSTFPKEEIYGITSQIRRSSVSIPSNVVEGFGRNSKNEFIRFLRISMGSLFELRTQIELSPNLGFLSEEVFEYLSEITLEIEKMLKGLIKSLK